VSPSSSSLLVDPVDVFIDSILLASGSVLTRRTIPSIVLRPLPSCRSSTRSIHRHAADPFFKPLRHPADLPSTSFVRSSTQSTLLLPLQPTLHRSSESICGQFDPSPATILHTSRSIHRHEADLPSIGTKPILLVIRPTDPQLSVTRCHCHCQLDIAIPGTISNKC